MFIKTLKYDFLFSKTVFLGMAAVMIVMAVILRFTEFAFTEGFSDDLVYSILTLILVVVCLAFIGQIVQFVYKNFFGSTGHLMLTLPVGRFTLLGSKLLVSFVWFTFMLITAFFMSYIIMFSQIQRAADYVMTDAAYIYDVLVILQIYLIAMFFVTMLFLVVTLAHSSIGRWRVPPFIAAVFGVMYTTLFFVLAEVLRWRSWYPEGVAIRYRHGGWFTVYSTFSGGSFVRVRPVLGLNVGRIPIGSAGNYLDIYIAVMGIGLCALAVFLTYWLLKRRVNLN